MWKQIATTPTQKIWKLVFNYVKSNGGKTCVTARTSY
jgi:hypothetical protein